jgi:O-methyltransferase domain
VNSSTSSPIDCVQPFGTEHDHAEMIDIIVSAARHEAVRCAALFSFADHLADGPKTAEQISQVEKLHPDATFRLMRACTTFGLLTYDKEIGFSATSLLNTLRRDDPTSMRDSIISWIGPAYQFPRAKMHETIRTGSTQVKETLGSTVWEYYATPEGAEESRGLMESMRLLSEAFAVEARQLIKVRQDDFVLDVGGGSGKLVLSLLQENQDVRGGVLELKESVLEAEKAAAALGFQNRFKAISGDFFAEVPQANVYLLKLVLHDWPEERCLTILRNIRKSMTPGSRLLIVEQVLDETTPSPIAAYLDLTMLTSFGGRERTLQEYGALLEAAGLRATGQIPAKTFPYAMIEAVAS